jgi:hypothetical protein
MLRPRRTIFAMTPVYQKWLSCIIYFDAAVTSCIFVVHVRSGNCHVGSMPVQLALSVVWIILSLFLMSTVKRPRPLSNIVRANLVLWVAGCTSVCVAEIVLLVYMEPLAVWHWPEECRIAWEHTGVCKPTCVICRQCAPHPVQAETVVATASLVFLYCVLGAVLVSILYHRRRSQTLYAPVSATDEIPPLQLSEMDSAAASLASDETAIESGGIQ